MVSEFKAGGLSEVCVEGEQKSRRSLKPILGRPFDSVNQRDSLVLLGLNELPDYGWGLNATMKHLVQYHSFFRCSLQFQPVIV
ncbi:MAG TPA: hypothetical protein VLA12_03085 [Planctomycetaceae bacterium]|nr:hypothetical protein [Planctomycetaceae bacterium]